MPVDQGRSDQPSWHQGTKSFYAPIAKSVRNLSSWKMLVPLTLQPTLPGAGCTQRFGTAFQSRSRNFPATLTTWSCTNAIRAHSWLPPQASTATRYGTRLATCLKNIALPIQNRTHPPFPPLPGMPVSPLHDSGFSRFPADGKAGTVHMNDISLR